MKVASYNFTWLLVALLKSTSYATRHLVSKTCQSSLNSSYASAITAYPNLKDQIEYVAQYPFAQWYTDRIADVSSLAKSILLPKCNSNDSNPPTVIVYGLPKKDCGHGFSNGGSNVNTEDYRVFLQQLATAAGDQSIVYILEPDAIGLLTNHGCGKEYQYLANLGVAMEILSQNANAEVYLDVGYWSLATDDQATAVAAIVNEIDSKAQCKGIALNTANYRSNEEMTTTCERFVKASGRTYKCIVDTSRNYVTESLEWCNSKWAGIGEVPTDKTGSDIISRYIWAKPPGDSDGECTSQSIDALHGPGAGQFFAKHFQILWNNGVFVHQQGMAPIDLTKSNSMAPQPTIVYIPKRNESVTQNVTLMTPQVDELPTQNIALTNPIDVVMQGSSTTAPDQGRIDDTIALSLAPVLDQVEPPRSITVMDAIPDKPHVDVNVVNSC